MDDGVRQRQIVLYDFAVVRGQALVEDWVAVLVEDVLARDVASQDNVYIIRRAAEHAVGVAGQTVEGTVAAGNIFRVLRQRQTDIHRSAGGRILHQAVCGVLVLVIEVGRHAIDRALKSGVLEDVDALVVQPDFPAVVEALLVLSTGACSHVVLLGSGSRIISRKYNLAVIL
jgi:hypothetical protein